MTSKCPLNRPKCKREIMTQRGPFKDERCPWSLKKKCVFSVSTCPMLSDREEFGEACMLNKINRVVMSGGCGVERLSVPPKRRTERYRQPCEKEAPPCGRCSMGAVNRSNKVTESVQQKEPRETKEKTKKKKGETAVPVTDSCHELSSKINDKLDDLKTRQHLTQPPCSTASRRPLPCCACMLEILGPQSDKAPDCTSPKAYAALKKPPCPFMRIIDTCPKSCRCENIPPIDTGPPCPFLPLKCPCCTEPMCPLNRIAQCPLIQNPPLPTPREGGQCACCCPVVPSNCSSTPPGCAQHNTTGLLGNRYLPVSGLVPRDPATGSPRPGNTYQESPPLANLPDGITACGCTRSALASLRLQGFDPVWQQLESVSPTTFSKPPAVTGVIPEGLKETPAKKRLRDVPDEVSKLIKPPTPPKSPEIKVKGSATLIKEGDGFKVFQKGNKKILINYKEKNCWLMGCSCGPKETSGSKDSDENCGCNDWVSASIKKKKGTAPAKKKTPNPSPVASKLKLTTATDVDKTAIPNVKQLADMSKSGDLLPSPLLSSFQPSLTQNLGAVEQLGDCNCVETLHCGMDQFKQQQVTTFNTNWPKHSSTKTEVPVSSTPPSIVPSVFSMTAPSYGSSCYEGQT